MEKNSQEKYIFYFIYMRPYVYDGPKHDKLFIQKTHKNDKYYEEKINILSKNTQIKKKIIYIQKISNY